MKKGIKFKIIGAFLLIFAVLGISSVWSVTTFNRLSNSIENIMQSNYRSIVAAQNMIVALERQDSFELAYMFSSDQVATKNFRENEIEFLKWLSRAEDNITEPGEKENLDQIHTLYSRYIDEFTVLVEIQANKGASEARIYYYNEILPLFEETKDACRSLQNLNQEGMILRKDAAHSISTNASYYTIMVSSATILIGLIIAIYLTNKIVNPVYNLIEKTRKISEGDYRQQLDISGKDEIAELAQEFNVMAKKLQSFDQLNVKKLMDEKQKAEAIVESISDGIIVTSDEHKLLLVNRAAETALGIREKDVLNKHFLEVIKREDIFNIIDKVKSTDSMEHYKKYTDITVNNGNGKKHYRLNVTPIRTRDGENIGFITLLQDITKLKEVDQIKSDFVSTVSHEFRTPLTSIGMGVGLLLDETPGTINNDQRELLEVIQEDSDRLKNLVSDLLDLSRIESGKIQMDIESYSIKDIAENASKPFHMIAKDKRIDIQLDMREELSKVKADFNKISLVLTNLIGNALKYTATDGTGKIVISARETANKMLICVSDNGKGIPEDYQQRIFEKFIQVKDDNGETPGGTGLGLAISKEIVNAHGGEIWVKSQLGEGSTFYFTLSLGR
ncbi:PAS domain S-box-containing protein [Anaerosolibacter carboniphilus]|uniref:histidine kinase n=1 Tax=Anaerosolibacter carboniphilus TaxID=1417629 RepID=A0A841L6W7_9FIRM|nr:ATP-binding protein [Anaerosolibacter carboniphilus]MBB6218139.1 PAS domain S-box-containing protein [Anaerosolibacter carboniphilus]